MYPNIIANGSRPKTKIRKTDVIKGYKDAFTIKAKSRRFEVVKKEVTGLRNERP